MHEAAARAQHPERLGVAERREDGRHRGELAVAERKLGRAARDQPGRPLGEPVREPPLRRVQHGRRGIEAHDPAHVLRLGGQKRARPAADVEQVVVGLQVDDLGDRRVHAGLPDRHELRDHPADRPVGKEPIPPAGRVQREVGVLVGERSLRSVTPEPAAGDGGGRDGGRGPAGDESELRAARMASSPGRLTRDRSRRWLVAAGAAARGCAATPALPRVGEWSDPCQTGTGTVASANVLKSPSMWRICRSKKLLVMKLLRTPGM